jgi:hypothetical protein
MAVLGVAGLALMAVRQTELRQLVALGVAVVHPAVLVVQAVGEALRVLPGKLVLVAAGLVAVLGLTLLETHL